MGLWSYNYGVSQLWVYDRIIMGLVSDVFAVAAN